MYKDKYVIQSYINIFKFLRILKWEQHLPNESEIFSSYSFGM